MKRALPLLAMAALIPAIIGPLPARAGTVLVMKLCNGGTVKVPLDNGQSPGGPPQGPCCAKGCHSGDRRKGSGETPDGTLPCC